VRSTYFALLLVGVLSSLTAVGIAALAQSCPEGGGYIFNASGNFICVPEVGNVSVGDVVVSAWMSRNDTVCVTLQYLLGRGYADVYVGILSPSGDLLWNGTYRLTPESPTALINVSLPTAYNYTVLNVSVNGFALGPYAVPYTGAEALVNTASYPLIIRVLLALVAVAPIVAVILRYSIRAGGLATMAISIIYAPIMYALGIPSPIPELVCSLAFIIGLLMVAVS